MHPREQFVAECKEILDKFTEKKQLKERREWMRNMIRKDLFFLGMFGCDRVDLNRDWLYDRCLEVQQNPDGRLDVWAREHYKSTIITFLKTIQDILIDPEERICIYSFNQNLAKAFVGQIKTELETNWKLKDLFPEILWEEPLKGTYIDEEGVRQRIPWTTDSIRVKRKNRAKEDTVTASGLVTGQKTGGHYTILVYDDVVTLDSVSTVEMIKKTTTAYQMSLNTSANAPGKPARIRIVGTFYHEMDTYSEIIKAGNTILRKYPAEDENRKPVLLSRENLDMKKASLGSWVYASQMLCDPRLSSNMGFRREWIKFWVPEVWENLNRFILVDPADSKKKKSDYTSILVIGLGADKNYYVIDIVRDKLSLTERTNILFKLHEKYRPQLGTFYEKVGMQSDISHIEFQMALRNYRFPIYEVNPKAAKGLRIESLEPLFKNGRIWFPEELWRKNWEGDMVDIMLEFMQEEYIAYPFCRHDDMIDNLAKITDESVVPSLTFPTVQSSDEMLLERLTGRPANMQEEYKPF